MLTLAVDTSSRNCSLALLRDLEVLAATAGVTDEPYASRVFTDMGRILGEAKVELPQIELFAVATGPGSFTGLRVGLAAVKGWAEVFARPIAAVSVLEAVAVQATVWAKATNQTVVAVMDARGGQLYGGIFRREESSAGLELVVEEVVLKAEEFFAWVAAKVEGKAPLFVTPTREMVEASLAGSALAGATVEEVSGELAPFVGRLGYERNLRGELVDALGLEANYVRRSDAEVKWRG